MNYGDNVSTMYNRTIRGRLLLALAFLSIAPTAFGVQGYFVNGLARNPAPNDISGTHGVSDCQNALDTHNTVLQSGGSHYGCDAADDPGTPRCGWSDWGVPVPAVNNCPEHNAHWIARCANGAEPILVLSVPHPQIYTPVCPELAPAEKETPRKMCEGNPCNPATGQKYQVETDYAAPWLTFKRIYNNKQYGRFDGVMGHYWRHTFERRIEDESVTAVRLYRETGQSFRFISSGGTWIPDADVVITLTPATVNGASGWEVMTESGDIELYDTDGRLVTLTPRGSEQSLTLTYDVDGRLEKVTGPFGTRELEFFYNAEGLIEKITTHNNEDYLYNYTDGNLTSVVYPDELGGTKTRTYKYDEPLHIHYLTGIEDENQDDYATWTYDAEGRATSSKHGGTLNAQHYTFDYTTTPGSTIVTGPKGLSRTYTFNNILGVNHPDTITGDKCANCGDQYADTDYDAAGFATKK